MGKEKPQKPNKKEGTPRAPRRRVSFRRRQQPTSIYFLLWTVFSLLSMVVVLLFSLTQRSLLVSSYKGVASREVSEKGGKIEQLLRESNESFVNDTYDEYIRFLSTTYDVEILILDEQGNLVYPKEPSLRPGSAEYEQRYNHADRLNELKLALEESGGESVVYEGDNEYVYGAKIRLNGNASTYLHVGKSLQFVQATVAHMNGRTVLLAVFVFLLSFAISSAVAGWLVKPLAEITEKAHRLAKGDFDVDFHGADYGKELIDLADSLNFARDELSKTDRMQKELIANVSHDFKTPLTMIKGYASMIMEISGDNPQKRNKHAQIIVDEADRLASLVSDVLDLSKIRSGIAQLRLSNVNMTAYVYEVLDRFDYLKDTQGYRFVVDAEEDLYAYADEGKIGQVLYNLIGNAVNYTGEDKTVYVSLKREGESNFRFAVRDTGAGIKREEISEIWDRYYRSAEAHKRPVQGTGLGLSIVKTIVERHGFVCGVESEVGKGSTFYVIFPLSGRVENA